MLWEYIFPIHENPTAGNLSSNSCVGKQIEFPKSPELWPTLSLSYQITQSHHFVHLEEMPWRSVMSLSLCFAKVGLVSPVLHPSDPSKRSSSRWVSLQNRTAGTHHPGSRLEQDRPCTAPWQSLTQRSLEEVPIHSALLPQCPQESSPLLGSHRGSPMSVMAPC